MALELDSSGEIRIVREQMEPAPPDASSLIPVHPAVMQVGTQVPADVYVASAQGLQFDLHSRAGEPVDGKFRSALAAAATERLFVRKRDRKPYWRYVGEHIGSIVGTDRLPRREASALVYELCRWTMAEVLQDPRSGQSVQRAHGLVEVIVRLLLRDPDALWHMAGVVPVRFRTYSHCVNVSMFLVAACRGVFGIDDAKTLRRIGMGAILHDIGKGELPEYLLAVPPERMEREEARAFREHPMLGLDILRGQGLVTPTSEAIIRWHHERVDGSGYPDGLSGKRLPAVVRLACIANAYDSLTTERPFGVARSPFEALQFMLSALPGRFDSDLVTKFAQFLGPTKATLNARFRPGRGPGSPLVH